MKKAITLCLFLGLIFLMVSILVMDENNGQVENVHEITAMVLETDNSNVIQSGISSIGYQFLEVEIMHGEYKGHIVTADNQLLGKLEIDSFFKPGDKIVAALLIENGEIAQAKALEIYRQDSLLLLFGFFVLCLIIYAGVIGLRALFSFLAALFIIWKFLIPGLLAGKEPLLLVFLVLTLLTALIMFSIAGFSKKGFAAFAGTMFGLFVTIMITIFFGEQFALNGMTSPFAETLLFSGHLDLNMQHIFYAAIIIGASGAAMDIAMDIAASMEEIKLKKPDINVYELIKSGFNVGRAVIGTMTTTLLLAYAGGYLSLLMLFTTQESSFIRIINLKIIAAEIMRTVVGSIGLVLVAPITAIIAGWILSTEIKSIFAAVPKMIVRKGAR